MLLVVMLCLAHKIPYRLRQGDSNEYLGKAIFVGAHLCIDVHAGNFVLA